MNIDNKILRVKDSLPLVPDGMENWIQKKNFFRLVEIVTIFTPLLILTWAYIFVKTRTKNVFRIWCDWAFKDSVDFLLWFKRIGWNYIVSSVIIH